MIGLGFVKGHTSLAALLQLDCWGAKVAARKSAATAVSQELDDGGRWTGGIGSACEGGGQSWQGHW